MGANRPQAALAAPGVIETSVTKSGHLGSEDDHRPARAIQQHGSYQASEQADRVAIDSVRLDTAYPRVAGSATVPLRSPFCSDDSAPATPRARSALPKAAQDAHSSLAAQAGAKTASQASSKSAPQAAAPGSRETETGEHASLAVSSPATVSEAHAGSGPSDVTTTGRFQQAALHKEAAELQVQSRAGQAVEGDAVDGDYTEASADRDGASKAEPHLQEAVQAPAAPQMPSWLMAELRSPSKRALQV